MSQHSCTITGCPRISRVLCYCCNNNYCIEHLRDHNEMYLSQLYQLTNEVNQLSEYFRSQYRQQLDNWRYQAHQTIDLYYEQKCKELDIKTVHNQRLNENRDVIEWIKLKINQLIREQNTTQKQIDSLKAATNAVRREITEMPKESFQLNIPPLILDENFIQLEKKRISFNLPSTIKSLVSTKNIPADDCIVMGNNANHFLFGQQSNLYLYDKDLNLIKQIPWSHGSIWDMCMSVILSKFILATADGVFTFDDKTMIVERLEVLSLENQSWYCCACSDRSTFLATQQLNTTVFEYTSTNNKLTLKQKARCCSNNEYIEHMKCTKDLLALIILNDLTGERRLDMRSTSKLDQIWSISLDIKEKANVVSCCSLDEKGWLVVDVVQTRLIHVDNQGYVKNSIAYKPTPHYAVQFSDEILAILTEHGINLHKIE